MHMVKAISEPFLYFRFHDDTLIKLTGNYVVDDLNAGKNEFQEEPKLTLNMFETKPRTYNNLSSFDIQLVSSVSEPIVFWQPKSFHALKVLNKKISFHELQQTCSMLAWTAHSLPDVVYVCDKATKVTEKSFRPNHVAMLNKEGKVLIKNAKRGTCCVKLTYEKLQSRAYADALFPSGDDMTSHLGYPHFLCNDIATATPLSSLARNQRELYARSWE